MKPGRDAQKFLAALVEYDDPVEMLYRLVDPKARVPPARVSRNATAQPALPPNPRGSFHVNLLQGANNMALTYLPYKYCHAAMCRNTA